MKGAGKGCLQAVCGVGSCPPNHPPSISTRAPPPLPYTHLVEVVVPNLVVLVDESDGLGEVQHVGGDGVGGEADGQLEAGGGPHSGVTGQGA